MPSDSPPSYAFTLPFSGPSPVQALPVASTISCSSNGSNSARQSSAPHSSFSVSSSTSTNTRVFPFSSSFLPSSGTGPFNNSNSNSNSNIISKIIQYDQLKHKQHPPVQCTQNNDEQPDHDPTKKLTFWQKLDKEITYLFQGKREEMWARDDRTEEEKRTPFDITKSSLRWGRKDLGFYDFSEQALQKQIQKQQRRELLAQQELQRLEALKNAPNELYESTQTENAGGAAMQNRVQYFADMADVPQDEDERILSGRDLAELCFDKYGHYHDIALVNVRPFGRDRLQVALNFYPPYLSGYGFRYTEQQYLDKLESICTILNALDQSWYVRKFLKEPKKVRKGFLASSPKEAFAVTLNLVESPTWKYIPQENLENWFRY